ncbi:hypothetical protein BLOT_005841 [Blomia tropicalis]|nr:hypothetical protein BLOT_005841 [Blomia tropicalis]
MYTIYFFFCFLVYNFDGNHPKEQRLRFILTEALWCIFSVFSILMYVHWLAMSSVSVNSFIYCWKDKNFRKAAVRVFCCFGTDNMSTPGRNNVIQDGQNRSNSNIRNGGKVRKLNLSVSCCERKSNEPNHNEMDEERRESTPLHPLPPLSSTSNVFGHKQSNVSMVTESSLVVFSSNGSVERLVDPTTKTIINNDNNTDVGGNVNQMNVPNRVVMKQRKQFKLFSWANKFPIHYSTGVRTNSPITMALTTTTTTPIVLDNPCQINVEECNDTVDIDFEHRKPYYFTVFIESTKRKIASSNNAIHS